MLKKLYFLVFATALSGAAAARSLPTTYELRLDGGGLAGSGAGILRHELQRAEFILYGEDHGFADSPILLRAIAHEARPLGFRTLVVEVGPTETQLVASTIRKDGLPGLSRMASGAPLALPFLSLKEDAELAADFIGKGSSSHLWGIDQEFMGAPVLLLERLVAIAPTQKARAYAQGLLEGERAAAEKAELGKFLLFSASDTEFLTLGAHFKGVDEAQRIIDSLRESAAIYQLYNSDKNYASNERRSRLLVSTFLANFKSAKDPGLKAIFKMGADHMGLGLTPNNTLDPGTVATAMALANGQTALRILFLPAGGHQLAFSPVAGNPFKIQTYNDEDTKDFFTAIGIDPKGLAQEGWTLIPLSPIREETLDAGGLSKLKPIVRFLLLGYDYVVTTPDAKAATPLYQGDGK